MHVEKGQRDEPALGQVEDANSLAALLGLRQARQVSFVVCAHALGHF